MLPLTSSPERGADVCGVRTPQPCGKLHQQESIKPSLASMRCSPSNQQQRVVLLLSHGMQLLAAGWGRVRVLAGVVKRLKRETSELRAPSSSVTTPQQSLAARRRWRE
ncbi:hypothetical protein Emed_006758 [Eimeria media]